MLSLDILIAAAAAVLILVTSCLVHACVDKKRMAVKAVLSLIFGGIGFGTVYFAPNQEQSTLAIVGVSLLGAFLCYFIYLSVTQAADAKGIITSVLAIAASGGTAVWAVRSMPEATVVAKIIPVIVATLGLVVVLVDFFAFHYKGKHLVDPDSMSMSARIKYLVAAAVSIIAAVFVIASMVAQTTQGPVYGGDDSVTTTSSTSKKASKDKLEDYVDIIYYNSLLQKDADKTNDYNFGPAGPTDSVKKTTKEFWIRMKHDPNFAAAQLWNEDRVCGTKFLSKYYDACGGDVGKAINTAAEAFEKSSTLWEKTVKSYAKWVKEHTVGYEIRTDYVWQSQAYMDPNHKTVTGRPLVIALRTASGFSYIYVQERLTDDGQIKEVVTRINCGYQCLDVETSGWKPSGDDPNPPTPNPPTPNPDPDGPENTDDPTGPRYNKDPNKAPAKNTEPNDDKGPYKKTKENKDPNSSDRMTYPGYVDNINNLEEINKTQKKPGDPNTPSVPKPTEDTKSDNNGDTGTGYGNADTSTTGVPTAREENGNTINEQSGVPWEGPTG